MNNFPQVDTSPAEVRGLAEARSILQEIMTPGGGISPAELVYGGTLRPASYDIILAGGGPGVNLTGRLAGRKVTSALLAYSNWHVQDVRVELTPSQSKALIDFAQTVIDGGHIS